MSQGDCKLQAAGLDRVQWAFVELMVVALEEERVTAMETSAKHSPPARCSLALPLCLLSLNLAAQTALWLTSSGVHRGADGQGPGVRAGTLREGFGCMMT